VLPRRPVAYPSSVSLKPYQEVAVAFAAALIARDFARARSMLTPSLGAELSEHALQERLTQMYRGYAHGEPSSSQFVPEGTLETWPGKQHGDLGWAYVNIEGDDFNEAVFVLVSDVDGVPMIKEIQWGRP
jgi:hypothetical protein